MFIISSWCSDLELATFKTAYQRCEDRVAYYRWNRCVLGGTHSSGQAIYTGSTKRLLKVFCPIQIWSAWHWQPHVELTTLWLVEHHHSAGSSDWVWRTGNLSFFWWYRKKLVPEKVSKPVSEKFGVPSHSATYIRILYWPDGTPVILSFLVSFTGSAMRISVPFCRSTNLPTWGGHLLCCRMIPRFYNTIL